MRRILPLLVLALAARAEDRLGPALLDLRAAAPAERAAAVAHVLALAPDPAEVLARLREGVPVAPLAPGWHLREAVDARGTARPYRLYVPKSLAAKPAPLLVYLHGGVARPDFAREEGGVGYASLWLESAERGGFAVACPLGRHDCTWWTETGAGHVRAVVRDAKRAVPVDDDAIVATGFSDGGSGCFYLALAAPDPFAAFLPMNGHPAVAATASGRPLYLRNLVRTPLYALMTRDDPLYPAASVLDHLHPALREGAPLRIVSYESGSHQPVYFDELRATLEDYVASALRDPYPPALDWWTAGPDRVAWVEITEVGPAAGDAEEPADLNVQSTPGRVRLGVTPDQAFPGPGVKVAEVSAGSPAAAMGLRAGDVVTGIDDTAVAGLPALLAALGEKAYGDEVRVTVERGAERLVLRGRFPPFAAVPVYVRKGPNAYLAVRATEEEIRITSRNVRGLTLHLPPDRTPVRVVVNRVERPAAPVVVPLEALLRDYAEHADPARLAERILRVSLPPG